MITESQKMVFGECISVSRKHLPTLTEYTQWGFLAVRRKLKDYLDKEG